MRIDLNVPFSEKDVAKKRGAKWDIDKKIWYVENHERLDLFLKWIPERLKQQTKSSPLIHPEHVVVQPRTPMKKNKKRR